MNSKLTAHYTQPGRTLVNRILKRFTPSGSLMHNNPMQRPLRKSPVPCGLLQFWFASRPSLSFQRVQKDAHSESSLN